MSQIETGGTVYRQTTVYIPRELHKNAKEQNLNMSDVLRKGLQKELQARGIEMQQTPKSPETGTPTAGTNASTHPIARRLRDE